MAKYRLDRSVFAVARRTTAFHDFLFDNYDSLEALAAHGPVPWRELLARDEIVALKLKRDGDVPVSAEYARKAWTDVKRRMKRRRRKADAVVLNATLAPGASRSVPSRNRSTGLVPIGMNSTLRSSDQVHVVAQGEAELPSYLARFKHCKYLTEMFSNGPRRPVILLTHIAGDVVGEIPLPQGIENCSDLGEEPEIVRITDKDEKFLLGVEQSRCRSHRERRVTGAYVWPPHWCLLQQTLPRNRIPAAFLAWKQNKINDVVDREYVMFD